MRKFLLMVAGVATTSFTTPLYADTLAHALEAAWSPDSEWSAALHTWQAGQENEQQGLVAILQNFSARYSWMDTDTKIRRSGYKMVYETETVTVSLAQPLFRPGACYAYKQGKAATSLADAQFADARQQFFHRVASAYFNVLKAWENLTSAN